MLRFGAATLHRGAWAAPGEIAAVGFFGRDDLPEPMTPRMRRRIHDAFAGKIGVVHVFDAQQRGISLATRTRSPRLVSRSCPPAGRDLPQRATGGRVG